MNQVEANPEFSAEELAALDAEIRNDLAAKRRVPKVLLGWIMLIGSFLGFVAAMALSLDKLIIAENPNATLNCDLNPFISCGTFLVTWQASALGVPNPFVGLGGFAIMGAVASLYISKAKLPRWFEWAVLGGLTFALVFVIFLQFNALFFIVALCPWCLVVWTVVPPMFFAKLANMVEEGFIDLGSTVNKILRSWIVLTVAYWAVILILIITIFWSGWMAVFGLN